MPIAVQLLTFDAGGVSGHPNHRAVWRGVTAWRRQRRQQRQPPQASYELQTMGLLLKYCTLLGLLAALLRAAAGRRHGRTCHICWRPWQAWAALLEHRSQMVW